MVQAYRICNWQELYEVTDKGNPWAAGKMEGGEERKLRGRPLPYARHPIEGRGLTITEDRQRLEEAIGMEGMLICEGLYWRLVEIAGDKDAEYRGWIVTGNLEAMDATLLARRLRLDMKQVTVALKALKQVGWIEFVKCSFAIECGQPVRFEEGDVKLGDLESSITLPKLPGIAGNPSEPNPNPKENINITESEGPPAGEGKPAEIVAGRSGGLIRAAAEESGSESEGSESGTGGRRISGPESGSESGGSGNRACSSPDQRLKEPSNLAKPRPVTLGIDPGEANGILSWPLLIGGLDVKRDDPGCLLADLNPNPRYALEQLIERMMIWFRLLCPSLEPPDMASEDVRRQAAVNNREIESWCAKVWDKFGAEGTVELIRFLQDIRKDCDRRRSRILNPIAVWVAKVKKKLEGQGNKSVAFVGPP